MKMRTIVVSSVLTVFLFLVSTAKSATYTCSSCEDCTSVLGSAEAGDIVELTTDISSESGSRCVDFGSSVGVIFDGREYTVSRGEGGSSGIYLRSSPGTGNTIRNVEISGFGTGIYIYAGGNHNIENCRIINNSTGIYMYASSANTIDRSLIKQNFQGLNITNNSDDNIIRNSFIIRNHNAGISFYPIQGSGDPENIRIYNNVISNMANGNIKISTPYDERDRDLSQIPFFFNTSLQCSQGANIMGCGCIGGNYWGEPLEQGFSLNCIDTDSNGICDESYTVPHATAVMVDNYPLTVPNAGCCANSDRDGDSFVSTVCGGTDHDDDPLGCGSSCFPGAAEVCDGCDNDGDGLADGTIACQDLLLDKNAILPIVVADQSCVDVPSLHKIFCFGGRTYGTYGYLDSIVSYDPAEDRVEELSVKLPTVRGSITCNYAPTTGKVYCFGGYWQQPGASYRTNDIIEFDPQDESLRVLPLSLPYSMSSIGSTWSDNTSSIFLIGGTSSVHSGNRDSIMEFDPVDLTIQTRSGVLPSTRYGLSCDENSATGKIYCFGGREESGAFSEILEYDPETDNVRVMNSAFPDTLQYTSCVEDSIDHLIYCLGGRIGGSYSDKIFVFNPELDTLGEKSSRFLRGRYGLDCTEDSTTNRIYCFGGSTNVVNISEIVEYTPALPIMGDVDGSGLVDLADLVQTLHVTVGLIPPVLTRKSDIGGNRQLGLEEAAYILHRLAD